MKKIIALVLSVIMVCGILAGCAAKKGTEDTTDGDAAGKAKLNIVLVLEDKTEEKHEISFTAGKNLREALFEGGLIEEDQLASMFITVINGHSADFNEGLTWMVKDEKGEQIKGMIDEIKPEDGQTIYMEYTVVPNFDD